MILVFGSFLLGGHRILAEFGFADEEEAFGPLFTGADLR